ncbi:Immunity protein 51, partial [Dysosmobacter welbionis]
PLYAEALVYGASIPEVRKQQLRDHLHQQQEQHDHHRRPDDFAAVPDGQAGAQIVSQDGGQSGRQPHTQNDGPRHQGGAHTADVGGQVDDLHSAGRVAGVHLAQVDEHQHQKGAGAGAVVAVIRPDEQRGGPDDGRLPPGRDGGRLLR